MESLLKAIAYAYILKHNTYAFFSERLEVQYLNLDP